MNQLFSVNDEHEIARHRPSIRTIFVLPVVPQNVGRVDTRRAPVELE
jgi:hypothetical protein